MSLYIPVPHRRNGSFFGFAPVSIFNRNWGEGQRRSKVLTSSSAHECAIGEVARSDGGVERLFKMSPLIFFLYSSQIQSFRFSVLTPSP
nr:MAG TPA: hypothetical protein [Caudoviricetes sp.]